MINKQKMNHKIICGRVARLSSRTLYRDQLCIASLAKQKEIYWHAYPLRLMMNIGRAKTKVQINRKIARRLIKPK